MKKFFEYLAYVLIAAGIAVAAIVASKASSTLDMQWSRTLMDGSRTGVQPVTVDNVGTALGSFDGETYVAPNGNRFESGSTPKVAALMIEVQPRLKHLKEVLGHCTEDMVAHGPESPLSNMMIDAMRAEGERIFKKPMDLALSNFGGIRTDFAQGPLILDDVLAMFPFKNYLVYAQVRGSELRKLFTQFAETGFQCLSGVRIVAKDHKLVSVEVGGKPLDDKRLYNMTTIDFLLGGGDHIAIGAMASKVVLSDVLIKDYMIRYIKAQTAAGKNIEYATDGRITIEK